MSEKIESPFWTCEEAAAYLRRHPITVYRWGLSKKIPSRKHGRNVVFLISDVIAFSEAGVRASEKPVLLSRFQVARERIRSSSLTTEVTHTRSPRSPLIKGVG